MKTMRAQNITGIISLMAGLFIGRMHGQTDVAQYHAVDLGTLGGNTCSAMGINELGQVVGYSYDSSNILSAFLYANGTMQNIGQAAIAYGINNQGQVVGSRVGLGAFLYQNGSIHYLPVLSGFARGAYAINELSYVVGANYANNDYTSSRAFLYDGVVVQDLGILSDRSIAYDINNNGQIVGEFYVDSANHHAFLYQSGLTHDLGTLGGNNSVAFQINDNGQIVGWSSTTGSPNHAFLHQNEVMQDLGTLGGSSSFAYGINSRGQVVGQSYNTGDNSSHPFLYQNGIMYDLTGLVDEGTHIGWEFWSAYRINNKGQIIVLAGNPSGEVHSFLLSPLPSGWRQAITTQPLRITLGNQAHGSSSRIP